MLPKLLATPDHINWYFDQAISWIGFITALIMLTIIVRKLNRNGIETDQKMDKTLKYWIYSLYSSNLCFMLAMCALVSMLPIFRALNISIDQSIACKAILYHMRIFGAWYHISVFNVFMQRIDLLCNDTIVEVSKFRFMVLRTIHFIIFLSMVVLLALNTDPSPYNVYTSSNDTDNGQTCSAFTSGKKDSRLNMLVISIGLSVLVSNICMDFVHA